MKPCPFCGSKSIDTVAEATKNKTYAVCDNCGARGPYTLQTYDPGDAVKDLPVASAARSEARRLWNNRE